MSITDPRPPPKTLAYQKTRKELRRARAQLDTDQPLSATENQPAVLHCDRCEMGDQMHLQWRSASGFPLRVLCQLCLDKGER